MPKGQGWRESRGREGVESGLEAWDERESLLENKSVDWVDKSKRKSHRRSLRDILKSKVDF